MLKEAIAGEKISRKLGKDVLLDMNKEETYEFMRDIMLHNYGQDHDLHAADFGKWFDERTKETGGIMFITADGNSFDLFEKCIRKRS